MVKWKLNEKVINEQLTKAKELTRLADETEPRATAAYFEQGAYKIVVELSNETDFRFSPSSVPELVSASPDELAQVEISPSGRTLRWKKLDADLSLPALMTGVFGAKLWMAHLGRLGGQATSQAKADAARLNGMKGGRPKKTVVKTVSAGTWKTKDARTSPSAKVTKSPRSVGASTLRQDAKTHARTNVKSVTGRMLSDKKRSTSTRSDKSVSRVSGKSKKK